MYAYFLNYQPHTYIQKIILLSKQKKDENFCPSLNRQLLFALNAQSEIKKRQSVNVRIQLVVGRSYTHNNADPH